MGFDQTNKRNVHRPHHIYDGHTFFVTGRCVEKKLFISSDGKKNIFKKVLKQVAEEERIGIFAWVVLDNHYHMLITLYPEVKTVCNDDKLTLVTPIDKKQGICEKSGVTSVSSLGRSSQNRGLVRFIRRLHANTAKEFNQLDNTPARKIWYQYYDRCIRNIPDFWKHFNYILKNPYKHGLVDSLQASFAYAYSSNPQWLARFGAEGLHEGFCKYPVDEVVEE